VNGFLADAASIFEAAEAAANASHAPEDWTILVKPDGALRMIASSDWPLDSLAIEHNAQSAFRVEHRSSRVTVEGRRQGRTVRLVSTPRPLAARVLLGL
jgi:hypothetical protein